MCAHAVCQKGAGNGGIVGRIVKDLEEFGYAGAPTRIKSDQGPAMLEVQRSISHKRKAQTSMANSPVGDSQSSGAAENAIRRFRGMYRTHKAAMETKLGRKLSHNEDMAQ